MFFDAVIKCFLVYLRIFCEFLGWKRAERYLRLLVDDEPDTTHEKHVV